MGNIRHSGRIASGFLEDFVRVLVVGVQVIGGQVVWTCALRDEDITSDSSGDETFKATPRPDIGPGLHPPGRTGFSLMSRKGLRQGNRYALGTAE